MEWNESMNNNSLHFTIRYSVLAMNTSIYHAKLPNFFSVLPFNRVFNLWKSIFTVPKSTVRGANLGCGVRSEKRKREKVDLISFDMIIKIKVWMYHEIQLYLLLLLLVSVQKCMNTSTIFENIGRRTDLLVCWLKNHDILIFLIGWLVWLLL